MNQEDRAKHTEVITKLIKEGDIYKLKQYSQNNSLHIDKIIKNSDSEYNTMLKKALTQHNRVKIIQKIKILKRMILPTIIIYSAYQFVKYYYITYYYIMWDVDIRKPKVSDYILERFR